MRAVIICNPRAGRGDASHQIDPAIFILEDAGWSIRVERSLHAGDATRLAQQAVDDGLEAVLVAGGDGTLNEAVQALAGTNVALGYLPHGTVNVWARELSIPLQTTAAARAIANGRVETVDLGLAGNRYFLLMAGIGFDSEVLRRARKLEHHKSRFGVLPYVAIGMSTVPRYKGADYELRYDGLIRRVEALMVVVGNTRLYGGRFQFTPSAVANDGWLDVCIVKGRGPLALLRQSLPLLLQGSVKRSDIEILRVREIAIQTDQHQPVQVDGELAGTTPLKVRIVPRALRVIVPRNFSSDLIL
ncbi:MAG: diacylglycerol kinase family lipid kinase [Chloroflexota bacterium]